MAGRKRKSAGSQQKEGTPSEENENKELNGNGVENSGSVEGSKDADSDKSDKERSAEPEAKQSGKKSKKSKRGRKPAAKNAPSDKEETEDEGQESKYEVEAVVDDKVVKGTLHYLIRWKGYSADDDTWEPEDTLSCPELVKKYLASKKKPNKKEEAKKSPSKKSKKGAQYSDSEEEVIPEKSKRGRKPKSSLSKKEKKGGDDSDEEDDGKEYEVGAIVEVHHKRNGGREFLVRWKGFTSKDDTWEPEENLNCPDLITKFMDKVDQAKSVDSRELRLNRIHTDRFSLDTQGKARRLSKRHEGKQRVHYHEAE